MRQWCEFIYVTLICEVLKFLSMVRDGTPCGGVFFLFRVDTPGGAQSTYSIAEDGLLWCVPLIGTHDNQTDQHTRTTTMIRTGRQK